MANVLAGTVALGLVLGAASGAFAQSVQQEREDEPGIVRWRNRPSFQFGDLRLDLRLKLAWDWRSFDPDIDEETFDFRTRRGGLNGEIGDHVEFQIERDLNEDGRWRDVFVNWRTFRQAEIMAGRFKVPFGHEQLIGSTDIDFAYRTLVSSIIPPARDKGVMVHGRFLQRGFTYQVGVFEGDGDNGRLEEAQFTRPETRAKGIGPSFAARVTATPLRPLAETFEDLRIGAAYGAADVPEGLNSLRGEAVWGEDFVEPVYVNGRRQRYGAEFVYTPGPVGLTAEWMQTREERTGQGLGDVDLSDFIGTGWYASATWLVTGEDKDSFNGPRRPLFTEGVGAIEIGARYEKLQFESASKVDEPFSNPRADNYLMNSDSVWTIGVNWFPNRWVRLLVNGIHEHFTDPDRTPVTGTTDFWSGVMRVQIVF